MDRTGFSTNAVFLLVVFLQLSSHQWTVKAAPLIICVDQELTITADSNLELYIDGVEVTNLQNPGFPGKADTVILRASAQVVAVSGQNEVIYGGFLASSGTFVTDASWKCTDQHQSDDRWQGVGFDDSSWKQAYEVRLHGDSPWYRVEGIRLDARWIWIKPEGCIPDGIVTVYCRKNLVGTCDYPPTPTSTEPPTTTTTTTTPEPTTTTTTTTTPEPTTTTTTTTTPEPTTTTTTTTTPEPTTTTTTTTTPEPTTTTTTTTTPEPTTTTTTTTTPEPTTTTTTTTTPIPTVPQTTATSTQAPLICPPQPTPPPGTDCSGTGVNCITTCEALGLPDGDYQSCLGCHVYVTCSNNITSPNRPCPACLVWDDNTKTCEDTSPTCTECQAKLCSGTGAACIGSCRRMADGDYQSCKGWDVYAKCSKGRLYDEQPCPAGDL